MKLVLGKRVLDENGVVKALLFWYEDVFVMVFLYV